MKLLEGKKLQEKRKKALVSKISKLKKKPVLAIVQIGNNASSNIYIEQKIRFGESVGIDVEVYKVGSNDQEVTVGEKYIKKLIDNLNEDKEVGGIIVQLPVPKTLNPYNIINFIDPRKDVDGLTSVNIQKLSSGENGVIPATTRGIKTLLDEYKISVKGKHVVIINHSFLVGRPTMNYFLNNDATVTVCHKSTKNLKEITKSADILITAVGKKGLINKDFVKRGQVVIDVGISRVGKKVYGDVNFEQVSKLASYITPVPGGVGPMTVLSLFENLLDVVTCK